MADQKDKAQEKKSRDASGGSGQDAEKGNGDSGSGGNMGA